MEIVNENKLCEICHSNKGIYTCPRCNTSYCSIICYRSNEHVNCSESFYQRCVMEEMSCDENDNASKQKMIETFQRIQGLDGTNEEYSDECSTLDSDDDLDSISLVDRLKDVNLDDSKEVWKRLNSDERQEFKALVRSGDINALVKEWQPWWLHQEGKVQELDSNLSYKDNCPKIKEDIKTFSTITTKEPAECVRYNLANIISSYTFTCRYFNGCHFEFIDEAVNCIVLLSLCLKDNINFEDADSAINSVHQECNKVLKISSNAENIKYVKEDYDNMLQGPNMLDKNYYLLCALSDIHNLFDEFMKRKSLFLRHNNRDHLKKMKIKLYVKKIEYFLSYVLCYVK